MMKRLTLLVICALFSVTVWSNQSLLKSDYPEKYVVVKGDTLWDIAGKFLQNPWNWPQIWQKNQQIENPHLIYPGDILRLVFIDGKPVLQLNNEVSTTNASAMEGSRLDSSIAFTSLDKIEAFLTSNRIVQDSTRHAAPYVISVEDRRVIAGSGDKIYARGNFPGNTALAVFRPGKVLIDPETGKALGLEASHIANVQVVTYRGDVAELMVQSSSQEIRQKDFLLPQRKPLDLSSYQPSAPDRQVQGQIVSIHGDANIGGRWNVVVLNRGFNQGLRPGNVLAIYQHNRRVKDPVRGDYVNLPVNRKGELIVFRVFEDMSYAMLMRVEDVIRAKDFVANP